MSGHWILDDQNQPRPCEDVERWLAWIADIDARVLARGFVGRWTVTTMFMGIDQEPREGVPPALWESEVAQDNALVDPRYTRRYRSLELAMAGHQALLDMIEGFGPPERSQG